LLAGEKIGKAINYVTHVFPLEKIHDGLNVIKRGEALKVVIKP
jgi:hypothetical protein